MMSSGVYAVCSEFTSISSLEQATVRRWHGIRECNYSSSSACLDDWHSRPATLTRACRNDPHDRALVAQLALGTISRSERLQPIALIEERQRPLDSDGEAGGARADAEGLQGA